MKRPKQDTGDGFFSRIFRKITRPISDFFYDISVKIHQISHKNSPQTVKKQSKMGGKVFYWAMFALPLLQFCIFYIGVNFNGILLAFQKITPTTTGRIIEFDGFNQFKVFWEQYLTTPAGIIAVKNSVAYFLFSVCVVIPLALLFSYYIYKKGALSGLFRTVLFMPSVICMLILVIFYQYIVDVAIPELAEMITGEKMEGLLTTAKTSMATLIFFNFWFSFGPSTLVYVNAMTQIEPSVVEAAELDGATGIKQFWFVILPMIFSSITSYLLISIVMVASNQLSAFDFFKFGAGNYEVQTIGYVLFRLVAIDAGNGANYTVAAAGGLMLTCVVAPLTLIVRTLLERLGPKTE